MPETVIADRYRLVRELGAGGMGVVWEAVDERLNRSVAVKRLRTQHGQTEAETHLMTERAMREARINARLEHPYAVSVFDVVEDHGSPCIVMELVPSVPLSAVMKDLGSLDPTETARVGSQVGAALAAAHALGIVHRDVKPGNVLIGDDGTARICDFGISRAYGDATLTITGMLTGTPAYLAPETARGEASTSASDVFSLGATLYAAVEGEPPFGNEGNPMAVLYRVVAGELRPPERAGAVEPLLLAMMSPAPEDRPTMAELSGQLADLANGRTVTPPPARPPAASPTLQLPVATTPASDSPPTAHFPAPARTSLPPPEPAGREHESVPPEEPVTQPLHRAQPPADSPRPADPPRPADLPPPAERPRRMGVIAVVVVAVVLLGIAVALLWPTLTGSSGGTGASNPPAGSTASSADPSSAAPSGPASTGAATAAELAQAVTAYYALLPDDTEAAWPLLTPAYQRQTGSQDSYERFWNDFETVTVSNVSGTAPDTVQATLTYVAKSSDRRSTERRSFTLVRTDGVLKINQSSII